MKATTSFFLFFACCCLFSCKPDSLGKKSGTPLFERQANTGIDFVNKVDNTRDFNILTYRNFYNGGGVATGDINNDGLADVFFTSNMGQNKLYLNKGNFQFEDISEKAGLKQSGKWGTGVVFVDINSDGWLDIYVCFAGFQKGISNENELYINNRNGTFTEAAKQYRLNESGYTTHAAFFDYDADGDLDCYVLKNSFIPVNTLNYANKRDLRAEDWPVADFLKGGGDKLLRNDGGTFTDVSKEAGIYGSLIGFGLGVTVSDVNGDHYPDIYISNDFFEKDYLYLNQKNGTFKEDLEGWIQHVSHSSMGADIGDINNDGYPDIFTTDMLPADDYRLKTTTSFESIDVNRLKVSSGFYNQFMQNCLQVNDGNGRFLETAFYSGVAASDWSWGALMFDADNDGLNDIYVCNGIKHDVTDQDFIDFFANDVIQKMVMTGKKEEVDEVIKKMPSNPIPNKAFRNLGNLKFSDEGDNWGFSEPSFSNGAACADLDNDGDLDLVINNVAEQAFVYKNRSRETNRNNFITVQLRGKEQNRLAVGSQIKVYQGSEILTREVVPSRGFQSSVDYRQVIGLGKKGVDSVVVIWPDRTYTRINKPQINTLLTVEQRDSQKLPESESKVVEQLLLQAKQTFDKHQEDDYIDFYYERNIPVMLSREGPKAASGDVNGDGKPDLYVCGAAGQAGQLYLQTEGGFAKKEVDVFKRFAAMEDAAARFFDCDGDRDLDLFVGTGGNNTSFLYELQNRLYINDGKGNYTLSATPLPPSGVNVSVVAPHDFDQDGDVDVFVGGRSIPQNYGVTPESYLLVNDGKGVFRDIAASTKTGISKVGMVTGAVWADMTGDGKKDLVIAGEWMAPKIFSYNGSGFAEVPTGLNNLFGWWQSVAVADMDGDGRNDLVLGNIGENFYLRPTEKAPVKLWMKDFDNNGTVEKVFSQTINGKDMPVFMRKEMTDQMVVLKKQNLKNVDYAQKSVQDLFTSEALKDATVKVFNYGSSCIAYNKGGKFTVEKLPYQLQLSSMNALLATDINGDNKPDLLAGGNQFNLLPQFCRLDASFGHVLINGGSGKLLPLSTKESGLSLRGEIRDIVPLRLGSQNSFLFLQNNDYPVLYRANQSRLLLAAKPK